MTQEQRRQKEEQEMEEIKLELKNQGMNDDEIQRYIANMKGDDQKELEQENDNNDLTFTDIQTRTNMKEEKMDLDPLQFDEEHMGNSNRSQTIQGSLNNFKNETSRQLEMNASKMRTDDQIINYQSKAIRTPKVDRKGKKVLKLQIEGSLKAGSVGSQSYTYEDDSLSFDIAKVVNNIG